ncbi:hypothetical protein [Gracilibacillus thailandensis]|uniref:DNA primase n=1 Tax=Gracilibacillus thailandensis TaxID=563735 RepID=A0A6N7QY37_9BACI|nr:hypothetical protein [Gracilibacillus thailandensis]MRI65795.1 hypothetical protein [Gracilibacillus thailandensis]
MKKKILSLIGVSVLTVGGLAACGEDESPDPAEDTPMEDQAPADEEAPMPEDDPATEEEAPAPEDDPAAEEDAPAPEDDPAAGEEAPADEEAPMEEDSGDNTGAEGEMNGDVELEEE